MDPIPVWIAARSAGAERIPIGFRQGSSSLVRSRPFFALPPFPDLLKRNGLEKCVSHECLAKGFVSGQVDVRGGTIGNLGADTWVLGLARIQPGRYYQNDLTQFTSVEKLMFQQYLSPTDFFTYHATDVWTLAEPMPIHFKMQDDGTVGLRGTRVRPANPYPMYNIWGSG